MCVLPILGLPQNFRQGLNFKAVKLKKEGKKSEHLGESAQAGQYFTFRIGRIPVQTPLVAQPGFVMQPCSEALNNLKVGQVSNEVINIELVRLSP